MIDIGANLADPSFDGDRRAVLDRAVDAGVTAIVVTGTSVPQSSRALALCREGGPLPLFCTAGIHPHDARHGSPDAIDALRNLAGAPEVRAIGETGLDFFRDLSPRDQQIACCEAQLALAAELGMPAFLHERDAPDAMIDLLRTWRPRLVDAVVHCFTGEASTLRAYMDLDCHIGITGWVCDERRGLGLRDIVPSIPDERLLIETDAPYLIPRTLRPRPKTRRNEPMWLAEVRDVVAGLRNTDPAELGACTAANAVRFFRLPDHALLPPRSAPPQA
ncbi:MAG: TatD family hydrolase [Planctomycetota bacterium]|nr:TatD family hydrolase [Planctomycetota bacterium]